MDGRLHHELLDLDGIEESLKHINKSYEFNGRKVPRVTSIIDQFEDQRYLINWAVGIGYRKYKAINEKSLEVGTLVHEAIDNYLIMKYKGGPTYDINYDLIEEDFREAVYLAYENFLLWEKNLNSHGYFIEELVGVEIPVVTPWYGGTIDAIFKINGAYYIIDFKTSKKISDNYLIQVAAYIWAVNNGYGNGLPMIDGVGIIRVDKSKYGIIDDLFLSKFDDKQVLVLGRCIECFLSYIEAYYRNLSAYYMIDNYSIGYQFEEAMPKHEE